MVDVEYFFERCGTPADLEWVITPCGALFAVIFFGTAIYMCLPLVKSDESPVMTGTVEALKWFFGKSEKKDVEAQEFLAEGKGRRRSMSLV